MELKGFRASWQKGDYFESWLDYVSNCPACQVELFKQKNKYRDVSKVVQCECGAKLKSLWIQARNFGLTFEIQDAMICLEAEPSSCPFHVLDD